MNTESELIFLLDVDNTLLDTDCMLCQFRELLLSEFGMENSEQYWRILEAQRKKLGYVDYLGALQQYRLSHFDDSTVMKIPSFLLDYPFKKRLFNHTLAVLKHLQTFGPTVILSDGDVVLQPRKIIRSGLWDAVDGQVLIYIHKEQMLNMVKRKYPAKHYVMIDDKLSILTTMKALWGPKLTTIFPRQGHYAHDIKHTLPYPTPDITIECIGDLLDYDFPLACS